MGKATNVYGNIYELDPIEVIGNVRRGDANSQIKKDIEKGNAIVYSPEDWASELKNYNLHEEEAENYGIDITKDYLKQVIKFCDEEFNDGWNFYGTIKKNNTYYRYVLFTAV